MLENTLVIANPAAHNGEGADAAAWLRRRIVQEGLEDAVAVVETAHAGEAAVLAERAVGTYRRVVALGGDGVVHEIAQGFLRRPVREWPTFGLLPCGNGNDYARTLGMPRSGIEDAWRALRHAEVRPLDVGVCNGVAFLETLSFGLDAAIALGTRERRERTGHQGTRLFVEEGIEQIVRHRNPFAFAMELEGVDRACPARGRDGVRAEQPCSVRGEMLLLAVQIGPTYGGGFRVCPHAAPDDGLFDVCVAHAPLGPLRAAALFLSAKNGRHIGRDDVFGFYRARALRLSFGKEPPVQADGEPLRGKEFAVKLFPGALRALCASSAAET